MSIPTVSVIVPNFNRADLLSEALTSVIDQTYQDFEILIVDDGSRDHSLEVIEAFTRKEPDKIRLFTHQDHANRGIQESHLLGIARSRGKYLAFLDNDDSWTPNYIAAKVEILDKKPEVGVVFSPYKVEGEKGFGFDMILRQWLLKPTIKQSRPFDNFANLLQFNNIASFSCFVTRRELLDGLPPLPTESLLFDWWVLLYLSTRSRFYRDNSSLTFWRWSRESAMGKQRYAELKEQVCRFMEMAYRRLDDQDHALIDTHPETFRRYKALIPYFLAYYRQPGLGNLLRFFRKSPYWAMASTLSLIINFTKYR